jgi:hypothetical protein
MEQTKQTRRMTLGAITKGPVRTPQRTVIYGTEGIGKSTWAASAPSPIFLPLEEGTNALDVARFPRVLTWADLLDALDELREADHGYRTVVVDTLDSLEPIVWKRTCETKLSGDKRVISIEDYGFAKGYIYALDLWRDLLTRLDTLRLARSMDVILVAHAALVTIKSPDTEDWQRYDLKLHQKASAAVREWADHVLFATTAVGMQKLNQRTKVTSLGERVLHTTNAAGWVAKTRSAAPAELPLSYDAWSEALATLDSVEALEAKIESLLPLIPSEKHATIRGFVEKAKRESNPGAALRIVANRVAATAAPKEAA